MAKRLNKKACYELMKEDYTRFYRPMPDSWKNLFPVITAEILEEMGLHITLKHTGKMVGMNSLSDSCKCNALCQNRIAASYRNLGIEVKDAASAKKALKKYLKENPFSTNICICVFYFADAQQDFQKSMRIPMEHNFEILNNGIIHRDWIPVINSLFFRLESFGDFASANAVINAYHFAKYNPLVNFTGWTKNLRYFHIAAEKGYNKPNNFKLVFSSFFINKPATIPTKYQYLVNAVFTVYTEAYAKKHNVAINCGARACLACLRCYKGFETGTVKYINELLK